MRDKAAKGFLNLVQLTAPFLPGLQETSLGALINSIMSPKFTVAICGGGVGGLACAVALSRYEDIQIDIYEAAEKFAEIGAGIGMWPRTWKIMRKLGIDTDLAKVAIVAPDSQSRVAFNFRKGDQPEGQTFYRLVTPGNMTTFHRPDFQSVLLGHLPPSCRTHTRKRLISYTQKLSQARHSSLPPIMLQFHDGSTASCDILIGADGVKSVARVSLVRELASSAIMEGRAQDAEEFLRCAQPRWSGTCAYRTTIPAETLRTRLPGHRVLEGPMLYIGKNTQLTVYPIARGTLINVAAMRSRYDLENSTLDGPWVQDALQQDMLNDFRQWEPEVQALLQCAQRTNRWAIHTTTPLLSFVSSRVALVGDAAHAMMPYQGAGAGQAIEDAYILATLLGHRNTTIAMIPRALKVYDAVRRPAAQRIATASRENGLLYTLNYPGLMFEHGDGEQSTKLLSEIAIRIRKSWEWAWDTTVDEDVDRAVRMLEGSSAAI
ncbi:hypothetical protein AcW1_006568 [Taiwanofungus camphoratus]|nr:hypothetical protein AcV5_009154 [Antrodia cinnamomea]KAI0924445.1 hypothetical protein AcW2_005328 [Antrodia cinnamomea]KAI0940707.1 hypothetical protein AcV7_003014 [Antrodia cinnamomea]KAI0954782.1 hypothetical protein AcW1_006568 [Antrodia cinnamomea]